MNEENINYVSSSDAAEAETIRAHPPIFTLNELFMFCDTLTSNVVLISMFLNASGAVKL